MNELMTPLESRTLLAVDLTATITVVPDSYLRGQTVPLLVRVTNAGSSGTFFPAQNSIVLSRDKTFGNGDDIFFGNFGVPGMSGNQSIDHDGSRFIAQDTPAGAYYVLVRLDTLSNVSESNESNIFTSEFPSVIVASEDLPPGPITGTSGNDIILLKQSQGRLIVTMNGIARAGAIPASLFIDAGTGNDKVFADASVTTRLAITGNTGNDTLVGGSSDDEISGAAGLDRVFGGAGNDFLLGGGSSDYLGGEAGNDLLIGGGGNDRLADVAGKDWLIGGLGNDTFVTRDPSSDALSDPDTVSGGAGHDRAQLNASGTFPDINSSLEEFLA